jgi:hypothetical protein
MLKPRNDSLHYEGESLSDWLRWQIEDSFDDPRPNVPAREVFDRLRAHHAARTAKEDEKV